MPTNLSPQHGDDDSGKRMLDEDIKSSLPTTFIIFPGGFEP